MTNKLLIILFFISNFVFGQKKDSVVEAKYYKSGKPKFITYYHGIDTFEIRKYYKNGQLGDSIWLVVSEKRETAFGTEKSYYENGKLSSITYHGKQEDEYITDSYRNNGTIYSHIVKPTGISKYYNSKGEVIKQFDENKFDDDVYIRKKYRKQRHLKNTNYVTRIKLKEALLTDEKTGVKISSGALISMILKTDTTVLTHCHIEGFSKDSIYFSKFEYNNLYDRLTNFEILKYDSTFALSTDQLKTIIYSKHYNKRRAIGAQSAFVIGTELKVFPILFGILLYKDIAVLSPYYGGSIVVGFLLTYYSKNLYKSMVPKTYDMQKWKIKTKN